MHYTEAPARREELLRRLARDGYVSSAQLAASLGVSEMTIRRDLRQLDSEGQARRVVGGASLPTWSGTGEPFQDRDRSGASEKRAIARLCAQHLVGTASVALDAGTTVAPVAELLEPATTVVTHSVPIIVSCTTRDDIELISLGGVYSAATRSFTGPAARAALDALSVDTAVLSATAVSGSGMLCATSLDAEIKQGMAAIAERRILLIDHTKLAARATIRFGALDSVDTVITDSLATPEQIAALRERVAEVLLAELEPARSVW